MIKAIKNFKNDLREVKQLQSELLYCLEAKEKVLSNSSKECFEMKVKKIQNALNNKSKLFSNIARIKNNEKCDFALSVKILNT